MLWITSDHAGFDLKQQIIAGLDLNWQDLVPNLIAADDYPLVAQELAFKLKQNPQDLAVAICGSGQGICMALNRFSWIRAGIANQLETASLLRKHNQANVLCLAGRQVTSVLALQLITKFLETQPDPAPRHQRRVKLLGELNQSITN